MNAGDLIRLVDLAARESKKLIDLEAEMLRRIISRITYEDGDRSAETGSTIRSENSGLPVSGEVLKNPDNIISMHEYLRARGRPDCWRKQHL